MRENPPGKAAGLRRAAGLPACTLRELRRAPRCPTTPRGIPVQLLVDPPRRRRWPWLVALALAPAATIPAWSGVLGRVLAGPEAPAPGPPAPPPAAVPRALPLEAPAPEGQAAAVAAREDRLDVYHPERTHGLPAEAYVARLAAGGTSTIRVLVFGANGREGAPPTRGCLEPAPGRFDERAAAGYHAIFRAAEAHGVKVVLSSLAIGFTSGDAERGERGRAASPGCDVAPWHRQGPDVHDVHALARALVAAARDPARHGEPLLVEALPGGAEATPPHDPAHVGLWAAAFAGAGVLARSAPPAEAASDAPMTPERARHLGTLAAFLARAGAREALRPVRDQGSSVKGMRVLAMAGQSTLALWLHAPRRGYGAPVRGAELALRGLAAGRWRITWVDDVGGADLASAERVAAAGAPLVVRVPEFTHHVAALAERIE